MINIFSFIFKGPQPLLTSGRSNLSKSRVKALLAKIKVSIYFLIFIPGKSLLSIHQTLDLSSALIALKSFFEYTLFNFIAILVWYPKISSDLKVSMPFDSIRYVDMHHLANIVGSSLGDRKTCNSKCNELFCTLMLIYG